MMISRTMQALLKEKPLYCAVVNKFAEPEATQYLHNHGCKPINGLPLPCFVNDPPNTPLPPSPQTTNKLLYYYTLDIASLFPILALGPHPHSNVLDMCAAPGGKSFALIQLLSLQNSKLGGTLALNDVSHSRLTRLKDVIFSKCLPSSLRHSVRITNRRGEDWGRTGERDYQCVLVDAPCSSDRHQIKQWIEKGRMYPNTNELSKLQEKLLLAALYATESGGTVVYSTCTLSTIENDGVIQRTLDVAREHGLYFKLNSDISMFTPLLQLCSYVSTDYGVLITPTGNTNCGPMYVSKLQN
ncbi:5-methylcytosine rRNA methyltransferase NSUN4-like [Halichondria panicea]|uniref:5-methylcytosine rRNA methyltransferase NSUN4-like n=1 Tax=Halichondria panicea TaxID=6063 RepID=UPI00312B7A56